MANTWELEIAERQRFQFGKNWQRFLLNVGEAQIRDAEASLPKMLDLPSLAGLSFLDIGSGSGIFSLAAMRLGARRVHSFDFDPDSVACARELKGRFYPQEEGWVIERGNALDADYLRGLGQWDVVYSWGVLHHTGSMWQALENVAGNVAKGGYLFISLYNDQGTLSSFWKRVKMFYNRGPVARFLMLLWYVPVFICGSFISDLLHLRNPLRRYLNAGRGMSIVYDWLDWLGGYPFEVAKPADVISFYERRGFVLTRLGAVGGRSACNEFVFRRSPEEEFSDGRKS
ncbi:MAG TPA: class I SAM-dependent methyltransferase [Pyrinomonadaceae bacterium]|nr:class I SAM-dependent methyltransferase [Pyrinomonadaceae bacterium]